MAACLEVETTLRLAQLEKIVAIKECAGLDAITELIERAPKDFLVYTGEDGLAFRHQGTWRTRGYFGSQSCLRFVNV